MSLDLGIKGKSALVIGGSRGLGMAVTLQLAESGAYVTAVGRGPFVSECHDGFSTICLDLMQDGSVDELVEQVEDEPDIIYYCMGGSYGGIKDVLSSADDYEKVWRFNLGIAIDLNRHLVPGMLERKWGRIVMTSTDGTKCNSGNSPYTSSKFALEGYVKTASKAWAKDNVILTSVAPGHVYTEGMWMYSQSEEWTADYFKHHAPINRWSSAEEIAKVVTFLCSEHASYMAGSIVRVDGGSR